MKFDPFACGSGSRAAAVAKSQSRASSGAPSRSYTEKYRSAGDSDSQAGRKSSTSDGRNPGRH
jgi:hypothetical protein